MTTWQDNAKEFAELDQGEGWPFAILVACSVELGAGQGARQPRDDSRDVKTSAKAFAKVAKTSDHRVARYLETWDLYAQDGSVPPSSTLTPEHAHGIVVHLPWRKQHGGKYEVPAGDKSEETAGTIRSAKSAIKKNPELVKELMADDGVKAVVAADPEVQAAVVEALEEEEEAPVTINAKGASKKKKKKPSNPIGPQPLTDPAGFGLEVANQVDGLMKVDSKLVNSLDLVAQYFEQVPDHVQVILVESLRRLGESVQSYIDQMIGSGYSEAEYVDAEIVEDDQLQLTT